MITIFNVDKNTESLSGHQKCMLIKYIDDYRKSPDGKWLNDVTFETMTYKWKADLEGGDVMAIKPTTGNTIYLQPNGNNPDFWVQLIAPAAIHELRHVWQRQKNGFLGYAFKSAWSKLVYFIDTEKYQTTSLEADAFDQQDRASAYFDKLTI